MQTSESRWAVIALDHPLRLGGRRDSRGTTRGFDPSRIRREHRAASVAKQPERQAESLSHGRLGFPGPGWACGAGAGDGGVDGTTGLVLDEWAADICERGLSWQTAQQSQCARCSEGSTGPAALRRPGLAARRPPNQWPRRPPNQRPRPPTTAAPAPPAPRASSATARRQIARELLRNLTVQIGPVARCAQVAWNQPRNSFARVNAARREILSRSVAARRPMRRRVAASTPGPKAGATAVASPSQPPPYSSHPR